MTRLTRQRISAILPLRIPCTAWRVSVLVDSSNEGYTQL